jgi:hypothetical protein
VRSFDIGNRTDFVRRVFASSQAPNASRVNRLPRPRLPTQERYTTETCRIGQSDLFDPLTFANLFLYLAFPGGGGMDGANLFAIRDSIHDLDIGLASLAIPLAETGTLQIIPLFTVPILLIYYDVNVPASIWIAKFCFYLAYCIPCN